MLPPIQGANFLYDRNGKVMSLSLTLAGASSDTLFCNLDVNPVRREFPPVMIILPNSSFFMSTSHWLMLSLTK